MIKQFSAIRLTTTQAATGATIDTAVTLWSDLWFSVVPVDTLSAVKQTLTSSSTNQLIDSRNLVMVRDLSLDVREDDRWTAATDGKVSRVVGVTRWGTSNQVLLEAAE